MITYEFKIFALSLLLILVALTMINFIVVSYSKTQLMTSLDEKITILINSNIDESDGIYITNELKKIKNFELYKIIAKKYIYISTDYLKYHLSKLIYSLFIWESVIILFISGLFYLLIYRFLNEKKAYNKTFEITLIVLNHKLRNFLSGLKINMELIKEIVNDSAVRRIEMLTENLEKENKEIYEKLNQVKGLTKIKVSKMNLSIMIKNIINNLEFSNKYKLKLRLNNVVSRINHIDLNFILYLLIDNQCKYMKKYGIIKVVKYYNSIFIIFRNDITENIKSGFGTGLSIVEKLCYENKIIIKRKVSKDKFTVILKLI